MTKPSSDAVPPNNALAAGQSLSRLLQFAVHTCVRKSRAEYLAQVSLVVSILRVMDELLQNRWSERDRELDDKILRWMGSMNARGMLQSSIAVKALHEIFAEEFTNSRGTIVKAIADSLNTGAVNVNRKALQDWASDQLQKRQVFLDGHFSQRGRVSLDALQNKAMIAPFADVARYYNHAAQELAIELTAAIDNYERTLGGTLLERTINRFKNHPIVVVGIIVIIVLSAIFGLISAVRQIGS